MSVTHKIEKYNSIHTFTGNITAADVHAHFDFDLEAYKKIGDAMAIILNFQQINRFSVQGLRAVQFRFSNSPSRFLPVAILGTTDKFLFSFAQSIATLMIQKRGLVAFHDSWEEALAWIDGKFSEDRASLEGEFSHLPADDVVAD